MSLEAIAERIREDAAKEAESIAGAADAERREALDAARRQLEDEFTRSLDRISREASEQEARLRFHAASEAGRLVENEKRMLLDRAISNAVDRLAGLPPEQYGELISSILASCTMTGDVEVSISPGDEGRITPALLAGASGGGRNFHLSSVRHAGRGGVVLTSGGVSLNATFSMLASLERERIVMQLAPLIADAASGTKG
ncbi:MAG: V-type ATP synthase subunit E [Candidatus Fermentibacter sp.]|nr:V-type ATP synthase subunit E [Candidatus Fermentibacter sp.]